METKFTKRKWYINRWGNIVSDTEEIAYMPTLTPKEEKEANALLISKAPEMFEMLEKWSILNPEHYKDLAGFINETKQLLKEATEL